MKLTVDTEPIDNSYIFLTDHKIILEGNNVLTGFALRKQKNKINYEYNFCELIENPVNKNNMLLKKGEYCYDVNNNKVDKICEDGLICKYENENLKTIKKCLPIVTEIDKGNLFCQSNCIINENSETKKCWDMDVKSCKKCTLKNEIKDSEKAEICQAICNANLPNQQCKFYGYINKEKKEISQKILEKYGQNIMRKFK